MSKRIVGITGPNGFVAGHLSRRLQHHSGMQVDLCPRENFDNEGALAEFVSRCDTIVHLAGMNRGTDEQIEATNSRLVDQLIAVAEQTGASPHFIFSSSTQSDGNNAYGRSKKYGEEKFSQWAKNSAERAASILVIPNVYGSGCRPYYNSVVATFCYQLARGEQPSVHQDSEVEFIWINDLIDVICEAIESPRAGSLRQRVPGSALLRVSQLLTKLCQFDSTQAQGNLVPDLSDPLDASLYATYQSYLSLQQHCHRPEVHRDQRGHLFEIIRLANGGQVFFSTTKPGVIRGNHFHTRKIEWFCVLQGEAAIRLRKVDEAEVHEFRVSGSEPQFISIPVLHTHQIENVGDEELLTMFWSSEIFTPEDADTYFEKVA